MLDKPFFLHSLPNKLNRIPPKTQNPHKKLIPNPIKLINTTNIIIIKIQHLQITKLLYPSKRNQIILWYYELRYELVARWHIVDDCYMLLGDVQSAELYLGGGGFGAIPAQHYLYLLSMKLSQSHFYQQPHNCAMTELAKYQQQPQTEGYYQQIESDRPPQPNPFNTQTSAPTPSPYNESPPNMNDTLTYTQPPIIVMNPTDNTKPSNAIQLLSDGSLQNRARLNFIKKVYTILILQLIFTIGFCTLCYEIPAIMEWQTQYWWTSLIMLAVVFVTMGVIFCSQFGRTHPGNLIMLLIFTLSFSYILSYATSAYAQAYGGPLIIQALAITVAMVLALTIYAFVTRTSFIWWIGVIIVVCICFIMFGLMSIFVWSPILDVLWATLGAILAGCLLILDTMLIIGGGRSIQVSMDDYVLGALMLYMDVIRIFMYVLMALGAGKK